MNEFHGHSHTFGYTIMLIDLIYQYWKMKHIKWTGLCGVFIFHSRAKLCMIILSRIDSALINFNYNVPLSWTKYITSKNGYNQNVANYLNLTLLFALSQFSIVICTEIFYFLTRNMREIEIWKFQYDV